MWTPSLLTLVVLGPGLLLACFGAEALRRRTHLHGGLPLLLLGIVAGPLLLGEALAVAPEQLTPLAAVLQGWVALQVGLGISFRRDGPLPDGSVRAGLLHAVMVLGLLGLLGWGLLSLLAESGFASGEAAFAGFILAAAGLAGSPDAITGVTQRFGARGPVRDAGEGLVRVARGFGVAAVGVAIAFRAGPELPSMLQALTPTERLLAELLVGVLLGLVADLFTSADEDAGRAALGLAATSALATGLAVVAGLGTLTVNLVAGLVLANFGRLPIPRAAFVASLERPVLYALLLYVGATCRPPLDVLLLGAAAAPLVLRPLVLRFAGSLASRTFDPGPAGLRRIGLAGLGQGAAPVAVALAVRPLVGDALATSILTVVVASVLLSELWGASAARLVLDEAGELPTPQPEG